MKSVKFEYYENSKKSKLNIWLQDLQVGKNLLNAVNTDFDKGEMSFISRITPTCCELELNVQRLDKQMSSLKPYKAMGHDEIRSQDLKVAGDSVNLGIRYIL